MSETAHFFRGDICNLKRLRLIVAQVLGSVSCENKTFRVRQMQLPIPAHLLSM